MPISGAEVKLLSTTLHFAGYIYKKVSVDASYKDSVKLQDRAAARMLEVKRITLDESWSAWQLEMGKADMALKVFEAEKAKVSRFPANLNLKKRYALARHANELHTKSKLLDLQAIKSSRESRFQYTASSGLHTPAKTAPKDPALKDANAPSIDAVHAKHTRHNQPRHKLTQPKDTRYRPRKYVRHSRPCVIVNVINVSSGPVATTSSDTTGVGKKVGADAVNILEDFSARRAADGAGSLSSDSASMTESVVSEFTEVLDDVASFISDGALTAQSTNSLAIVDDIVS